MSEFFASLLKGILSFSLATLVIVVQPSAVADDLSDETIQAELGLPAATFDKSIIMEAKATDKVATKEEKVKTKEHTKPVLAAPGLAMPTKK